MKVVAYSIQPVEKEFLAKANQKKHDITIISNPLTLETAMYAIGKDAIIIGDQDAVSAGVMEKLAGIHIRFIVTRTLQHSHIDKAAAARYGIKLASVLSSVPQQVADQTITSLDLWQLNKCVGDACVCAKSCKAIKTQED
jgi:lactate dehydrogenase-like 2-hydroxyacid dehydrogenase